MKAGTEKEREREREKVRDRDIAVLHAVAGALFGVVTGLYLRTPGLTLISVLLLGLLASYPLMLLTQKLYWEDMEFKAWLGKGFYIFFAVWVIIWTFVYNLA